MLFSSIYEYNNNNDKVVNQNRNLQGNSETVKQKLHISLKNNTQNNIIDSIFKQMKRMLTIYRHI